MTSLLQFEDKVHHKGLARAESLPLLMPRLLCQVLEHLGFLEEPRIEREAPIRRAPYFGERRASLERLPWGVILRRPSTDG